MSVLKKFRKQAKHEPSESQQTLPTYKGVGGAMRSDEYGTPYWLNEEQLRHVARLNAEIDDDTEFWAAFRKYRLDQKIWSTRYQATPRKEAFNKDDYTFHDPTKNKSSLSEWWTGWKSSFGWGGGQETKLALAKRAVEVTVNVVDDSGSRMRVDFASQNDIPISATSFEAHRIIVSAKPIIDHLPDGKAIDIISGFGLHEASHSKYTRQLIGQMDKPEPLKPYAPSHILMNILEDSRIEGLTSKEFPGFAKYFDIARDYMWDVGQSKAPTAYGPDLMSKIRCVVGFCRWPEHFKDNKDFTSEFGWWRAWQDDYLSEKTTIREAVELAIAHLRMATPPEMAGGKGKDDERSESGKSGQASEDLDKQEAYEKEMGDLAEALRQFLEEHAKDMPGFCTHREMPDHDKIEAGLAEAIEQKLAEDVREERTVVTATGAANPKLIITKPLENADTKRHGSQTKSALVQKYRHALLFRPAKPLHAIKLTKDGKVDPTQLWRWAGDDWRVFQHKEIADRPSARVYLLVDVSGSMSGSKVNTAFQVAQLMVSALTSIDGVNTKVFAHSGDMDEPDTSNIYRIWEPGDPITRLGLIPWVGHGNNYDGHAIAWVARQLERDAQPGEQQMVLVLSDGLPSGHGYGGGPAYRHMRDIVERHHKRGMPIIQIAIDRSLDEHRQSQMFREFVSFRPGDSLDLIPGRVAKILRRVL